MQKSIIISQTSCLTGYKLIYYFFQNEISLVIDSSFDFDHFSHSTGQLSSQMSHTSNCLLSKWAIAIRAEKDHQTYFRLILNFNLTTTTYNCHRNQTLLRCLELAEALRFAGSHSLADTGRTREVTQSITAAILLRTW